MLSGDGNDSDLHSDIIFIDLNSPRFFLCMREVEEEAVSLPDPEKLALLVNYVRSVASYLENLDGVEIIVKNQISWPRLEQSQKPIS